MDSVKHHMGQNLETLQSWFPSGTAEGERQIQERVFVYVSDFPRILSPRAGNPYLLVGRKGTGKSAIIEVATRILDRQKVPSVLIRPSDLDASGLGENDSIGELKHRFQPLLLSAIASKLAENRQGLALGDEAIIYNEAIRSGHLSSDLIGKLARSLPKIAKPLIKVDLTQILPEFTAVTRKELEEAIGRRVKDERFHLFIDDTDQIANPDRPGHLNRIWGLILAARELASDIPQLRCVVSLREEVWERLKRESSAQRDQTDHFTNLVVNLSSSDKLIKEIIETRLKLASAECGGGTEMWTTFFEGAAARPPNSETPRSWIDLVLVRSRQRPRDAIQLISQLADHASNKQHISKINETTFQTVMPRFSEDRARLFGQEFELECPRAEDILRTFSQVEYSEGGFRMTAESAKSHLTSAASQFGITLYGRTIKPNLEVDIFDLWRFLYVANVLNARVSDTGERDEFRHVRSEDDPFLVSKPRWNEMQKMLWEVNPAFRDYLETKRNAQQAMTGLPTKEKQRRARRARLRSK
ncbi:P-loop ATPase, Sll1717 family [Caulobacter sp. S45]|uniref:P-loop ATPase, Sll1717 family n=1 Tax=Caulobacter sp. S45 TaxID=1641861 RepID=UPI00131E2E37|nr:hypothetical protein [Caulobacter sp. S45]